MVLEPSSSSWGLVNLLPSFMSSTKADKTGSDSQSGEIYLIFHRCHCQSQTYPGLSLTSVPLKSDNNYISWSNNIVTCLMTKGIYINGKLPQTAEKAPEYAVWEENDSMILAWIRNSLCDNIQESCAHTANAKELWDSLKERYG